MLRQKVCEPNLLKGWLLSVLLTSGALSDPVPFDIIVQKMHLSPNPHLNTLDLQDRFRSPMLLTTLRTLGRLIPFLCLELAMLDGKDSWTGLARLSDPRLKQDRECWRMVLRPWTKTETQQETCKVPTTAHHASQNGVFPIHLLPILLRQLNFASLVLSLGVAVLHPSFWV